MIRNLILIFFLTYKIFASAQDISDKLEPYITLNEPVYATLYNQMNCN